MRSGRATRRLAQLADVAGGTHPWYVRRPIPPGQQAFFPAEGWYWVPPGHDVAVYLGGSEIDATIALHRLITDDQQGAAA